MYKSWKELVGGPRRRWKIMLKFKLQKFDGWCEADSTGF